MSYTGVIVESPSKCSKIESFLGEGYKCIACFGHLRKLDDLSCIDTHDNFKPTFKVITSKMNQIEVLRKFIKESKEVILAMDKDREGESIAWHLCELFELSVCDTKRIVFREISENALKTAISSPSKINLNLVHAQQSRQILDMVVGFKISPVLWKNINVKQKISVGRCQTPALKLVYDNQVCIDKFPRKKVYDTVAYFTSKHLEFNLNYRHDCKNDMETFLKNSINFQHVFHRDPIKTIIKSPPLPLNTSSLLQMCNFELKMTLNATMESCQRLYEHGYITYMRTDSKSYSLDFVEELKSFLLKTYGNEYVNENIDSLSNSFNDAEAHESIRPIHLCIEDINCAELTLKDKRVYSIIRRNTIESGMSCSLYNRLTAKVTAINEYEYTYHCEQVVFAGWKQCLGVKENPMFTFIQNLKEGPIFYKKIVSKVVMKEVKSHYSEANLVKLLEEYGIGRPSTFASLVEKIQERGYVKKMNVDELTMECIDFHLEQDHLSIQNVTKKYGGEKQKLIIQPLGVTVIEFVNNAFHPFFQYNYTKSLEDTLDLISKGESVWHELCRDCWCHIDNLIKNIKQETIRIDDTHEYILSKYGPVIKCIENDKVTFKKMRKDVKLDKLKEGEYELNDLIVPNLKERSLGYHDEKEVILKKGRFGLYLEWNKEKINIQESYHYDTVELKDISNLLVKQIMLNVSEEVSIRNGKYGAYIHYKTNTMSKPKFIAVDKDLNVPYDINETKKWLFKKHKIRI
jgi:DNA topoisomerase I